MKDKLKRAIIKFNTHPLPEKIFLVLFFLFFAFEALIVIVPFFTVIMNSLKSADEILSNPIALPTNPRFINFIEVFTYPNGFFIKGKIGYGLMF